MNSPAVADLRRSDVGNPRLTKQNYEIQAVTHRKRNGNTDRACNVDMNLSVSEENQCSLSRKSDIRLYLDAGNSSGH